MDIVLFSHYYSVYGREKYTKVEPV